MTFVFSQLAGDRAFSAAPPRGWNRLPMEFRHLRSTPLFKRKLNRPTFLFTAELQNWTVIWTDYIMLPRAAVDVDGALELLFYWNTVF